MAHLCHARRRSGDNAHRWLWKLRWKVAVEPTWWGKLRPPEGVMEAFAAVWTLNFLGPWATACCIRRLEIHKLSLLRSVNVLQRGQQCLRVVVMGGVFLLVRILPESPQGILVQAVEHIQRALFS
jgi:hypothetical protein